MATQSSGVGIARFRPSLTWVRAVQVVSIGTALAVVAVFLANLLFTPVQGSVLVLLSARTPDRTNGFSVELHSSNGSWTTLGRITAQSVPAAPDTSEAIQTSAAVGEYDAVRIDGSTTAVQIQVQRSILATILIAMSAGRPVPNGIYAGSEGVSLGLNELSGQMRAVPTFNLVDQFGRPFNNATIAGHVVVLAAFHTTCHETCPLVTGLFLQLRRLLPPSVMLVEATVDPTEDTPDVLRGYAGRVGAAWTFITADPASMAAFWKPFDVQLSSGDVHQSTLAIIDAHGYLRSFWLGAPDVAGKLSPDLEAQLSPAGLQLLNRHGNDWGPSQVIDSVQAVGGLASPSSGGEGPAPDFTLSTLEGKAVKLSDLRGQPVLINFWATYCVPCRTEMPLIERMTAAHPKLVVLLIDERDERGAARQFVSDLNIQSTVLYDGDGQAGDLYRISGFPTTLFVRSDGTIQGRYVGQTDEQILDAHMSAIGA